MMNQLNSDVVAASVASFMASSKRQPRAAETGELLEVLQGFDKGRSSSMEVIDIVCRRQAGAWCDTDHVLRRR